MGAFNYERRKHDNVGTKYEMKTDNKKKQLKGQLKGMAWEGKRKWGRQGVKSIEPSVLVHRFKVGTVSRVRDGQLRNRSWIPGTDKRLSCSPKRPHWLWKHSDSHSVCTGHYSPGGKAGKATDPWSWLSSAEVRNERATFHPPPPQYLYAVHRNNFTFTLYICYSRCFLLPN
jgi:hypothetical protein